MGNNSAKYPGGKGGKVIEEMGVLNKIACLLAALAGILSAAALALPPEYRPIATALAGVFTAAAVLLHVLDHYLNPPPAVGS